MIYVCSDIHGSLERYKQMIQTIKDDDFLFILGDIIDRGKDGIAILKDVMKRNNVITLMGNHEHMMYMSLVLQDETMVYNWLHPQNGGQKTCNDFLEQDEDTQNEIIQYLKNMPIYTHFTLNNKKYYLSHGCYVESDNKKTPLITDLDSNDVFKIVWESPFTDNKLISTYKNHDVFIHGHKFVQHFFDHYEAVVLSSKNFDPTLPDFDIIDIDGGCACIGNPVITKTALILYNLTNEKEHYFI